EYLKKALALDPYNEDFLEVYVDKSNDWEVAESYQYRYLALFNPNSSKYQELSLDFDLHNDTLEIDYMQEEVITTLIEAIIDLEQKHTYQDFKEENDAEMFQQIIQEVGVEKETVQMLEEVLPGHLETILKGFRGEERWDNILTIYLSVEKVLAIAPYNPLVLLITTFFYASVYPRILLQFHINSDLAYKSEKLEIFFQAVFHKTQLSKKERLEEAKKSFQKSIQLKERYSKMVAAMLSHKEERVVQRFNLSMIDLMRTPRKIRNILDLYQGFEREDEQYQLEEHFIQLEAFFEQEFLTFQVEINASKSATVAKGFPITGFVSGLAIGATLYVSSPSLFFLVVSPLLGAMLENLYRQIKAKPKKEPTLLPFHKDNLAAL
ncbi:MAG: hypothetical protein AAF734_12055, partial [Bacteroidota bacterium]